MLIIIFWMSGCLFTLLLAFLFDYFFRTQELRRAQNVAQDILQSALDKESLSKEHIAFSIREKEQQIKQAFNKDIKKIKDEKSQIQSYIDKEKSKNNISLRSVQSQVQRIEQRVQPLEKELNNRIMEDRKENEKLVRRKKKYIESLVQRFSLNIEVIKKEIEERELNAVQTYLNADFQKFMENSQKDAESNAIKILNQILNRFQKPYCSERGISFVELKKTRSLKNILGSGREFLNDVEKRCGVDVVVDEENLSLSVQGLDPVRREWGRLSLSKLSRKNKINRGMIANIVRTAKRELFRKIRNDGQRICNQLQIKKPDLKVCDMMGALRYRYSFAQNQYFHCEEVGWLCGLLAVELGVNKDGMKEARRSGLFHDIGKAMDHAQSGGHAMIGADFIKKYGEGDRVVRAVRAHHHDVRPEHYLDFLVITADAMSGSRPGARRSTVDSYNQKVLSLERIGKDFEGVKDIYVMNAGREVRVIVNSNMVTDKRALELSREMAQRIEEECSYPGWIKVTVVRKVESSRMTRLAQ